MDTQRIRINDDILEITPLGGGCEVGRSCIYINFKGKKILLDCGIHPSDNDLSSLPFFDKINPEEIDLLLITHFHLDHCGSAPYFIEKTSFKGKTYMTYPTKAIYKHVLLDSLKVGMAWETQSLFSREDVINSMEKISALNFHEEHEYKGIKFVAYNAGHVIGAAMFMIEISGVRILYTGDYSREEDLHIRPAEIPNLVIDVLIVESTYGIKTHEPRELREKLFLDTVEKIVSRNGKCLLPVFVLGRAQELLLLLEENWQRKEELQHIPIYYASTLMAKCMLIFQTYVNMMGHNVKEKMKKGHNPFDFKFISVLKSVEAMKDGDNPMVVMASPGMLQKGLSRTLFQKWCHDDKNGVLFTGYCVENTFARDVLNGKREFKKDNDQVGHIKMSVEYISFSAHADYNQTKDFIEALKPKLVVLVHGEKHEAHRLKKALEAHFGETVKFEAPSNWQSVEMKVPHKENCKVIGSLVDDINEKIKEQKKYGDCKMDIEGMLADDGSFVEVDYETILLRKNFKYFLVKPQEVSQLVGDDICTIDQKLHVKYSHSIDLAYFIVQQIVPQTSITKVDNLDRIIVKNAIHIYKISPEEAIVEWTSSEFYDIIGDCLAYLLHNIGAYENLDIFDGTTKDQGSAYNNQELLLNALKQNFENDDVNLDNGDIVVHNKTGSLVLRINKESNDVAFGANEVVISQAKNLINLIY